MKTYVIEEGFVDHNNEWLDDTTGLKQWDGRERMVEGEFDLAIKVAKPDGDDAYDLDSIVIHEAYKPNSNERYRVGDEHHTYAE